jgi:3-dehydroquinate dehydratase
LNETVEQDSNLTADQSNYAEAESTEEWLKGSNPRRLQRIIINPKTFNHSGATKHNGGIK